MIGLGSDKKKKCMYVYCIHITDISSSEEGGVSFGTLMYPDLRDRAWQTNSAWEPSSQDRTFFQA